MRFTPSHILPLALLAALVPGAAMAQEAEAAVEEIQPCTAALTPALIPAGEAAVKVKATLTQDIGTIDGLQSPEGSGLLIVSPEDVPMEEMANTEDAAAAEMTDMAAEEAVEANTFVVWLNAFEATPGSFEITLMGENGTCAATVEVKGTEESAN